MQRFLRVLIAAHAIVGAVGRTDAAGEVAARRWLQVHQQAPSADDLTDLKNTNPDAYAMVKMLLTKQSMGLIKRNHHGLEPPPMSLGPMDESMVGAAPPSVVAQGDPRPLYGGAGPPAPAELSELPQAPPTAPPAMPPPPPLSPEGPPDLEDPLAGAVQDVMGPQPSPAPAPTQPAVEEIAKAPLPEPLAEPAAPLAEPAIPVARMSAASTGSKLSSGSSVNSLSWNPDAQAAENERMVQSVMGAVAQLTGKKPVRKQKEDQAASPLAKDEIPDEPMPAPHRAAQIEDETPEAPTAPVAHKPSGDQVIAENDKMVNNLLNTVTQLTGRTVKHHDQDDYVSPLAKDDLPDPIVDATPAAPPATVPVMQKPAGDQVIAQNDKMVNNLLNTVRQLTGRTVNRKTEDDVGASVSEASSAPVVQALREETPIPENPSAADLYLASGPGLRVQPEDSRSQSVAEQFVSSGSKAPAAIAADAAADAMAGHLPETVSWSNPYTFTASASDAKAAPKEENSYLKDIDFGISKKTDRSFHRTPDDQNPYLQGLGMTTAQAASTAITPGSLSAMHQSQLVVSHHLLSSFDWGNTIAQPRKRQALIKKSPAVAVKDPLSGFLGPNIDRKPPKKAPAMVSKNAYLAKLDSGSSGSVAAVATADSSLSSGLASDIQRDNPYLQTLDGPVAYDPTEEASKPNLRTAARSTMWEAAMQPEAAVHPKMSMASSKVKQQVVASKVVAQTKKKAAAETKKKALKGWLGGEAAAKGPNMREQRLQQQVAQRVADAKNPYLNGLDIDDLKDRNPYVHGVAPVSKDSNPYLASLD